MTQISSWAKEYYSIRLELLTNATVVDDAIMFVSSQQQQQQKERNGKAKTNL
ncbi:MAG: hypothetical protein JO297_17020 [Nitrososphaeraceae archaeon]|nr:hypothetical protein [Nitrososphaeraceae archaeon]